MKLYDLADVIRSKNAGPFTLTIDVLFATAEDMDRAVCAPLLAPDAIAKLYDAEPGSIAVHAFREVLALKITMPRAISSGAPADRDVYGSQQHFPLADIDIDIP